MDLAIANLIIGGVLVPLLIMLWMRISRMKANELKHVYERLATIETDIGKLHEKVDKHIEFHLKQGQS